jgi:arabinan endo-1,5-alpha-L-arabinosidase
VIVNRPTTVNRRTFVTGAAAAVAGAAGLRRARSTARTARARTSGLYRNPVFEEVFADPTAIRADDGAYYAYATFNPWPGASREDRLIPIARSRDLVRWEDVGDAFETKPDWRDEGGLWAPHVARVAGRYLLYYSYARFGDPNPGIGVAVAESPAGPFEDRGALLRSDEIGVRNSIDPYLLVDDGTPYLFWGSKRGIYGVRLSDDGLSLAGEKFRIAGDGVEAPWLIRRRGRYYFFGSRGTCCRGADSTYRVVVGRGESLRGPYVNREGESLRRAPGTTILRGDEYFAGPGHNAVVRDDAGVDWLLYHAYERHNPWVGSIPRRVLMLDRLVWRDGWPTVETRTPSRVAPAPTIRPR